MLQPTAKWNFTKHSERGKEGVCHVLIYSYNFQWQQQLLNTHRISVVCVCACVCVCLCVQTLPTCIWYRAESRKRSSWWTSRGERADGLPHAAADMNWERVNRDEGTEGGRTEGGRTAFLTRHEGGCSLSVTPACTHTCTHARTVSPKPLPGVRQLVSWCIQVTWDKVNRIMLWFKEIIYKPRRSCSESFMTMVQHYWHHELVLFTYTTTYTTFLVQLSSHWQRMTHIATVENSFYIFISHTLSF